MVKEVTKMGERGPVIFNRHFFTLVWNILQFLVTQKVKFYLSPRILTDSMSTTLSGSTLWGSLCLDWWHKGSFKRDFHIRCQCTTSWGNLQDGLQRKIALLRFSFKQDKMFDNVSFSRAGLTKALMLVCLMETPNVRFQKFRNLESLLSQVGFGFQELQLSYFCGSNR